MTEQNSDKPQNQIGTFRIQDPVVITSMVKLFIEKGMIKQKIVIPNAYFEIIPQKVNIKSKWKRKIAQPFRASLVGYNVPVKEYKNVKCLQVKIERVDLKVVRYEYYAPNIGLVKAELFTNGQKSFEQILKNFKGK